LEDQGNQTEFIYKYFSGIEKGDFYEEPVQGVYPDWLLLLWLAFVTQSHRFFFLIKRFSSKSPFS
tara:strand:- start:1110 stop:1304 length:195 start_codon:yes stop_codon:yes gene_type:complete